MKKFIIPAFLVSAIGLQVTDVRNRQAAFDFQIEQQLITGTVSSNNRVEDLIPEGGVAREKKWPKSFGRSLAPAGYIDFCRSDPDECDVGEPMRNMTVAPVVKLTNRTLEDLDVINQHVNGKVVSISDQEHHNREELWGYPLNDHGDCEDYVLLKRKMLIGVGWDPDVLLISVVYDEDGLGHAVLNVRTDKGDLVLDNRRDDIRFWYDTAYDYVAQQSQQHPLLWISLKGEQEGLPPQTVANNR